MKTSMAAAAAAFDSLHACKLDGLCFLLQPPWLDTSQKENTSGRSHAQSGDDGKSRTEALTSLSQV